MSNLSVFKAHRYVVTECWGVYVRLYLAADKQSFGGFFLRNSVLGGVGNHHVFPFTECSS